jgi:hypothetical protein
MDMVALPTTLVEGVSALEQTNLFTAGAGNDTGPLRGSTAQRAQEALDAMTPEERAHVQTLLDGAKDGTRREWILAAVASGLDGQALDRYAGQLDKMTSQELAAMSGQGVDSTGRSVFTQPDSTACGSSSLVMARMLNDPAYAMYIATGYDPHTDTHAAALPYDSGAKNTLPAGSDPALEQMQRRFQQDALAMHNQTNDGVWNNGLQVPWPKDFGTQPWAAANQMSGDSGVPGSTYDVQVVDLDNRSRTYNDVVKAVNNGHAVPVYTYDIDVNRDGNPSDTGAHVTLVVGTSGDDLKVYEPTSGQTRTVSRAEFEGSLTNKLGWDRPMAAVLPK